MRVTFRGFGSKVWRKVLIGKYEAEPSIKDDLLNYFEGEITFK